MLSPSALDQRLERWKTRLAGLTELQLPTDYPRPHPLKVVESVLRHSLPEATSLALLKLSLAASASASTPPSPFTVVLTAFSVLLHRWTGEEDMTVGSSSTASNPLVLRIPISPDQSLSSLVAQVGDLENEAIADEVPFTKLLDALGNSSSSSSDNPSPHVPAPFKVRFFDKNDATAHTFAQTTRMSELTVVIHTLSSSAHALVPRVELAVTYNQVRNPHHSSSPPALYALSSLYQLSLSLPYLFRLGCTHFESG